MTTIEEAMRNEVPPPPPRLKIINYGFWFFAPEDLESIEVMVSKQTIYIVLMFRSGNALEKKLLPWSDDNLSTAKQEAKRLANNVWPEKSTYEV